MSSPASPYRSAGLCGIRQGRDRGDPPVRRPASRRGGAAYEALEGEARSRNVCDRVRDPSSRRNATIIRPSIRPPRRSAPAPPSASSWSSRSGVMPKGYWIGPRRRHQPGRLSGLREGQRARLRKFGARFPRSRRTVRGGRGRGAQPQHRARVPELSAGARLLARPGYQAVKAARRPLHRRHSRHRGIRGAAAP